VTAAPIRARARSPQAKEEQRSRILAEAIALFVEEGYAGFSMRKLAQRLHFTATTLYGYFKNKDDLLLAIIDQGYGLFRQHLNVASGDPAAQFGAIGKAVMDFAFKNPQLYTLMFIHRPGPLFDLSPEAVHTRLGLLTGVAQVARKTPLLASQDESAIAHTVELYWACIHGLIALTLTIPLFNETWARQNFAFLLNALTPMLQQSDKQAEAVWHSQKAAES
jgi:AcrR family transcriptional regulator